MSTLNGVGLASTQTSLTMQFSLEPEQSTPILDHVLPYLFLGLQDTTCQVNEYIIYPASENIATIYDLLKLQSLPRALDPMGQRPDLNLGYHMLITEPVLYGLLYGRMSEYALRHNHAVQMSSSTDPQMNQVVDLELHL